VCDEHLVCVDEDSECPALVCVDEHSEYPQGIDRCDSMSRANGLSLKKWHMKLVHSVMQSCRSSL
jgi:hypothetical protein